MNNNNKSTELWVNRLFEHSGSSLRLTQGKTYYAHRYHDDKSLLSQTPFSVLFSGFSNHNEQQELEPNEFKDFFAQKAESSCKTNSLIATDEGLNLVSKAASCTQFTVLNCYQETVDTKTFRLGSLDGRTFDYLPGQYITLLAMIAGQLYTRSYSLASAPSHSKIIEITVKRDPNGGVVSNWLNDELKVGDTLDIKGPFGKFSCAPKAPPKIVLLAAGSGVVPIMSMLRWLADSEAQVDISVLLSFRTVNDIIYRDELNLIAARHHNIDLFITLTAEQPDLNPWSGLAGRVNQNLIAALIPDLPQRTVYLCGPDAFMADCKDYLHGLKLPDEQLFCESFTLKNPVSAVHNATDSQRSIIKLATVQLSGSTTGNYQIRFAKSKKTIRADGSRTILEVAEAAGIKLAHECRAGSCGECMVKCLKGRINMSGQAEIADCDKKKGWAYACCAYPVSNVVLDV